MKRPKMLEQCRAQMGSCLWSLLDPFGLFSSVFRCFSCSVTSLTRLGTGWSMRTRAMGM